ncbi:MAG: hypothetical protein J0L93_04000 [Deltaproteobacteria bacterium]|nr:hypothetical protein [Deltaproteobacteria bacterium]
MKLLQRFIPLVFILTTALSSFAGFAQSRNPEEVRAEYDQFLRRLGYEDYSAQIRGLLDSGKVTSEKQRKSLEYNQKRYEIINHSRELAVRLMIALEKIKDPKKRDLFIGRALELTARCIDLQPGNPEKEIPTEIKNLPAKQREAALKEHISHFIASKILQQTTEVTSNFIETLNGASSVESLAETLAKNQSWNPELETTAKEFWEIHKLVQEVVSFMWLDSTMGQTSFLGRALALSLRRYEFFHKDSKITLPLQKKLELRDLDLGNFVGTTLSIPDEFGRRQLFNVRTGDRVFERTRELEAAQITNGAIPHWGRVWFAAQRGLIGTFSAMFWPSGEMAAAKLSPGQMLRLKASSTHYGSYGVSHIGTAWVPEDPETGIKTTWALDIYPGGIRQVGIMDAFALPGIFMKIAFARDNPEKLWDLAHAQIEARKDHFSGRFAYEKDGYWEVLWNSDVKLLQDGGSSLLVKWPVMISREEFVKLHSIPRERAKEWYSQVMTRLTDHIRHFYLTQNGTEFSYGFSDKAGELYCASTYCVGMMQSSGVDPQLKKDQYNPVILTLAKVSRWKIFKNIKALEALHNLDIDQPRIVTPVGLAVADTIDKVNIVRFPTMTQEEQMASLTDPAKAPMNTSLFQRWQGILSILANRYPKTSSEIHPDEELIELVKRAMEGNSQMQIKSAHTLLSSGSHGLGRSALGRCVRLVRSLSLN